MNSKEKFAGKIKEKTKNNKIAEKFEEKNRKKIEKMTD